MAKVIKAAKAVGRRHRLSGVKSGPPVSVLRAGSKAKQAYWAGWYGLENFVN